MQDMKDDRETPDADQEPAASDNRARDQEQDGRRHLATSQCEPDEAWQSGPGENVGRFRRERKICRFRHNYQSDHPLQDE